MNCIRWRRNRLQVDVNFSRQICILVVASSVLCLWEAAAGYAALLIWHVLDLKEGLLNTFLSLGQVLPLSLIEKLSAYAAILN